MICAAVTSRKCSIATCFVCHENDQVIIVENEHPPDFVYKEGTVTVFTKNLHQGRYGFFPTS